MHLQTNVLEYLEDTAARLPDKAAFVDSGKSYSFSYIMQSSRALGSLICIRAPLRSMVAVLCDRAALPLIGFFAALYAGCCYVPLDAKMPQARLETIVSQVSPAIILYSDKDARVAATLEKYAPALCIENGILSASDNTELARRREAVIDIDTVYMIFTSGSTGVPKGIPVTHHALIDFTEWLGGECGIGEGDVLGNQSPLYFDTSVKNVYQTLRSGCTTHILNKKLFMFPTLLADYLNENKLTALIWSTSAFRLVADSGILAVKKPEFVHTVAVGGETLFSKHLRIWQTALPDCRFFNHYGPTEVTVDCTSYEIKRSFADGEPVPIGKSCRNMEVILLDDDGLPVEDGGVGEICVRGGGITPGYFDDFEKTHSSFVQNPMNPHYPDIIYKTGDMAKRDSDGNLIFLSRRDDMIKHMGYRIELGEIETALSAENVCAVCFFDEALDFIVCCAETTLDAAELASLAGTLLPKYMIPNVWRVCGKLPLNANGKIDRALLKERYFNEKN